MPRLLFLPVCGMRVVNPHTGEVVPPEGARMDEDHREVGFWVRAGALVPAVLEVPIGPDGNPLPVAPVPDDEDTDDEDTVAIEDMTKAQLLELAASLQVEVPAGANKAAVLEAVLAAYGAEDTTEGGE